MFNEDSPSEICVKFPSSTKLISSDNEEKIQQNQQKQFLKFFTNHLISQLSFPFHWKWPNTSLFWGKPRNSSSLSSLPDSIDPFIHPRAIFPIYKDVGDKLLSVKCEGKKGLLESASRCCVEMKSKNDDDGDEIFRLPDCVRNRSSRKGRNSSSCRISPFPRMFVKG